MHNLYAAFNFLACRLLTHAKLSVTVASPETAAQPGHFPLLPCLLQPVAPAVVIQHRQRRPMLRAHQVPRSALTGAAAAALGVWVAA